MKLLVTGGAGFIGSNFIRYWLSKHPGDQIANLDALTYAGNLENLKAVEKNPNYSFIKADICDPEAVEKAMQGADAVVHFAAESHNDRAIKEPGIFVKTNVLGTQNLLEAALKSGKKRFHHVSTDEVFGSLGPDDPKFSETTPYDPRSPYSASKAASDHLVRAYFHTYGLPVTISNCTNNYGPYQFPEKLIPLFVTNLLEGRKVPLYGQGQNVRDWIFVDDHNRGVDLILQKGRLGETYCLGGDNEISNIELTRILLSSLGMGEEMIEFVKDRPGHDFRYAMEYAKAERELGWKPEVPFTEGLPLVIEWYRGNADWWKNIRSGAYQDYYDIQYGKT